MEEDMEARMAHEDGSPDTADVLSPLRSERQGASPVALGVGDDTRGAWSCPLPNEIFTVGSQGQDEGIAGLGVAIALHGLLANAGEGWLPALFNETVVPLTRLGAPLPSFPFVDLDHVMLSQGLMRQFVMVLVARFRMSVAEIVIAYTLVKRMLWLYPNLLRCYSVRPIFLGCCVLAVKMSREGTPSLSCLLSRVQDVFNLLNVRLLSRIEHQLLEVLGWRMPMEAEQYQAYADELFGVAADALLAPPMQAPQILVSWEPPPVCEHAR